MTNTPYPRQLTLKIHYRATSSLSPNPNNVRLHPRKQIEKIKAAIRQFGFSSPLIVDQGGMLYCGHGRLQAAVELGMAEVPVIVRDDLTGPDIRAYAIADNVLADKGGYSKALLRDELRYLAEVGYVVEITGLDTLEIDQMLSIDDDESVSEPDDIVAPPTIGAPICRVGDYWHIGDHRLIVGDACDAIVLERLLDGQRVQLILTDPPYGCAIANNVSGLGKIKHQNFLQGAGQETLPELAMNILRPAFRNAARHCEAGAIAFVCSDWRAAPHMADAAEGVFLTVKNWIVWVKTNAGMGSFYRSQYELILAFKVSAGTNINNFNLGEGGRHRSNVWTYAGANTFRKGRMTDLIAHPTVKPKKMFADAILDCSRRGGLVLDMFAGSGTTLVAAAMTGRRGYGVELDPKYADVILARVAAETGKPPLLEGVETFESVAARRDKSVGGDA